MNKLDKMLCAVRLPEADELGQFLDGIPTDVLRELAEGLPLEGEATITDERIREIYSAYGGERFLCGDANA